MRSKKRIEYLLINAHAEKGLCEGRGEIEKGKELGVIIDTLSWVLDTKRYEPTEVLNNLPKSKDKQ